MANFQVLFNGEVAEKASQDHVRENLARELGLDDRKAKQLFSGRTVVIRSQLDQHEAEAWQAKLAQLGAVCRVKDLTPKADIASYNVDKSHSERTLRDLTAAHVECPRCGHMQLDSGHCARCGVDLEQAFKQKRKEDLLIEKKIRELRASQAPQPGPEYDSSEAGDAVYADEDLHHAHTGHPALREKEKKGLLGWLKRR
ncbi:MAG: hypothetical protein AAF993_21800 [Pseudomonadota bacterium]